MATLTQSAAVRWLSVRLLRCTSAAVRPRSAKTAANPVKTAVMASRPKSRGVSRRASAAVATMTAPCCTTRPPPIQARPASVDSRSRTSTPVSAPAASPGGTDCPTAIAHHAATGRVTRKGRRLPGAKRLYCQWKWGSRLHRRAQCPAPAPVSASWPCLRPSPGKRGDVVGLLRASGVLTTTASGSGLGSAFGGRRRPRHLWCHGVRRDPARRRDARRRRRRRGSWSSWTRRRRASFASC